MTDHPTALVVGAGVIGLTSAHRLTEAGFAVSLVTRARPEDTTSAVSAALWYPFAAEPPERVDAWARATYDAFRAEAATEDCVWWTEVRELFRASPPPPPPWADVVEGYRTLRADELPVGCTGGHAFTAPVAEMPAYLRVLEQRLGARGVVLERGVVEDLDAAAGRADVVVVCAGLGARELAADAEVYPIHGQVARVAPPLGASLPGALIDDEHPDGITYLIRRRRDVVLGGLALPRVEERPPDPEVAASILRRCAEHVPALADARVLGHAAAARPGRTTVRLEREDRGGGVVIHNYGHGGAGMTLSWGCADEVVALARAAVGGGGG